MIPVNITLLYTQNRSCVYGLLNSPIADAFMNALIGADFDKSTRSLVVSKRLEKTSSIYLS